MWFSSQHTVCHCIERVLKFFLFVDILKTNISLLHVLAKSINGENWFPMIQSVNCKAHWAFYTYIYPVHTSFHMHQMMNAFYLIQKNESKKTGQLSILKSRGSEGTTDATLSFKRSYKNGLLKINFLPTLTGRQIYDAYNCGTLLVS